MTETLTLTATTLAMEYCQCRSEQSECLYEVVEELKGLREPLPMDCAKQSFETLMVESLGDLRVGHRCFENYTQIFEQYPLPINDLLFKDDNQ